MSEHPSSQLEGIARLLGATAVLVVTWPEGGVAQVRAASHAALDGHRFSLPHDLLPMPGGHCLARLTGDEGALVRALRAVGVPTSCGDGRRTMAVASFEASIGGAQDDRAAMLVAWEGASEVPGLVAEQASTLRPMLAGIVHHVVMGQSEAKARGRLEALIESVPEGIVLTDREGGNARVNAAAATLLGVAPGNVAADVLAAAMRALIARTADPDALLRDGSALLQHADAVRRDWSWEVVRPERRVLRVATLPVHAESHRGRLWTFEDITTLEGQRVELERALSRLEEERDRLWEAEHRFRLATRATRDIIWDWEAEGDRIHWSDGLRTTFGHEPSAIATWQDWKGLVHPDDRARVLATTERAMAGAQESWSEEYRFRRADGSYANVRDRGTCVRDPDGRVVRMIGAMQDESARLTLESQLRQVQKMEGIGRLAGGVAHDFNNLLTVIRGSVDFARGALPPASAATEDLDEALRAVERATALTRQLLAFSRRQVMQPRAIDVHEIIAGVEKLLRRVIGEHIVLRTRLEADRCIVLADPGQVEQVLVNLAVNARDAMPDGGELVLRTLSSLPSDADGDVIPLGAARILGEAHLLVAVTDTGTGMEPAVLAKAFEPFFTTKDVSKGSGLGLSIVHGIIAQSGGEVWLESAPGRGTTAWIALPLTEARLERGSDAATAPARPRASTVLVVEDEASVRALLARMLRAAGYEVVTAPNGREGLVAWEERRGAQRGIDAVVSDVVMPDMGGRDFVAKIRATRADVPVLFVSGYTDGELAANAIGGRSAFLEKPFSSAALLSKLAGVLAVD